MIFPCDKITQQMGSLFSCERSSDFVRVHTPFLYPDGDEIEIFVTDDGGKFTLSDFGETLRWLSMQRAAQKHTSKQDRLIQDVCMTHSIQLFRSTLTARCESIESLCDCILRLSQACGRVADLWLTFRQSAVSWVMAEVADLLLASHIPYERNKSLMGESGRKWTIDFFTNTTSHSALIQVLSTTSRSAAHKVTDHAFTGWHDLQSLRAKIDHARFVTLFDDTAGIWRPEDMKLLEQVSDVARWSNRGEFISLIAA